MKLAIFDLDGTVLRGNSWRFYLEWIICRHPWIVCGLVVPLTLRAIRQRSGRELREAALKPLRGLDAAAIRSIGGKLIDARLRRDIRRSARCEIATRLAEGLEGVLATGAFDFIAEPLAEELGLRHVICSRLEYDEHGRFTGRVAVPETRGDYKASAVRERFADVAVDWLGSCAFSDDMEDAPLLSMVGHAVLVGPIYKGTPLPGMAVVHWD